VVVAFGPWLLVAAAVAAVVFLVIKNWHTILAFLKTIPGIIIGIFKAAGTWLLNAGKAILQGLLTGLKFLWNLAWTWYVTLPLKILSVFANAIGWLLGKGKDVLRGLWNGLKAIWRDVSGWVAGIPGRIVKAIGDVGRLLFDIGKKILQSLWDGMKSLVGSVVGWLGDKVKGLVHTVTFGLFGSPKLFTYYLGQGLMTQMAEGLRKGSPAVEKEIKRALGTITAGLGGTAEVGLHTRPFTPPGLAVAAQHVNAHAHLPSVLAARGPTTFAPVIHIHTTGPMDEEKVARAVSRKLADFVRQFDTGV
jgi:phage-related protein